MTSLRTKGKSTIVWLLMGMLLLGLGGFGVTSFSGTRSGTIGSVGDAEIGTDDYLRGIRSEMQAFSAQTGQNMTPDQARALGVPQTVQARLFLAAALEDEARRLGVSVGDEVVAKQIAEAPGFQGLGGQFDAARYQDVLAREGLRPAEFEEDVRMDEARMMLQRAVIDGVTAPHTLSQRTAGWLLETRDLSWTEFTAANLPEPVAAPDDEVLQAWHTANAARFTAPEIRKITYAWLTPEMLADTVQLDETALRDLYQSRIAEFQQPERRMVERLVYPSDAEAEAAKARLDAGQATFEQLTNERGLQLTDIDLGEMTEAQLGAAGAPVFALNQPGVVGPITTDLGPALFSMNAILDPVNVTFEDAAPDLRGEAAADRAKRVIEEKAPQFEDLLAGGASLEDLVKETPMQLGQIDYGADTPSEGIAAYQTFRERARVLTAQDFPTLTQLDDGGLMALRLDEIVPPALKPFAEVRDEVLADWTSAETRRELKAIADDRRLEIEAGAPAPAPADADADADAAAPAAGSAADQPTPAPGLPALQSAPAVERDTGIEAVPAEVTAAAFRLTEPGESVVVEAENRVFLIRLDAVHPADLTTDESGPIVSGVTNRLTESLRADLFDAYARAIQAERGIRIDSAAIAAADALIQ